VSFFRDRVASVRDAAFAQTKIADISMIPMRGEWS
jgi:hypothetical protein